MCAMRVWGGVGRASTSSRHPCGLEVGSTRWPCAFFVQLPEGQTLAGFQPVGRGDHSKRAARRGLSRGGVWAGARGSAWVCRTLVRRPGGVRAARAQLAVHAQLRADEAALAAFKVNSALAFGRSHASGMFSTRPCCSRRPCRSLAVSAQCRLLGIPFNSLCCLCVF